MPRTCLSVFGRVKRLFWTGGAYRRLDKLFLNFPKNQKKYIWFGGLEEDIYGLWYGSRFFPGLRSLRERGAPRRRPSARRGLRSLRERGAPRRRPTASRWNGPYPHRKEILSVPVPVPQNGLKRGSQS